MFILLVSLAENEPNNSIAESNPIGINSSSNGHIGGGVSPNIDNQDWWVVTLTTQGSLIINTTSGTDLCVVSYLYLSDGTTILANTWSPPCSETSRTMNVPNLAPGTYYIKVGNYSGAGNYTISTTFTYSYYPSDLEPNNYMIQAI